MKLPLILLVRSKFKSVRFLLRVLLKNKITAGKGCKENSKES